MISDRVRAKVIAAWHGQKSEAALAAKFRMSTRSVRRIFAQARAAGALPADAPRPHFAVNSARRRKRPPSAVAAPLAPCGPEIAIGTDLDDGSDDVPIRVPDPDPLLARLQQFHAGRPSDDIDPAIERDAIPLARIRQSDNAFTKQRPNMSDPQTRHAHACDLLSAMRRNFQCDDAVTEILLRAAAMTVADDIVRAVSVDMLCLRLRTHSRQYHDESLREFWRRCDAALASMGGGMECAA